MDTIAKRLKLARIAAGYRTAKEFADKNAVPQSTYALHETGGRNLTRDVALKYAALLHISVDWLLKGGSLSRGHKNDIATAQGILEEIPVVGDVRAGNWKEALQWPQEEWKRIFVPADSRFQGLTKYALEVVGSSMDQVYPHGSFVVCVNLIELGRDAKTGERVHVQCSRPNGLVEATIKEYIERDDGSRWLVPRSTDPAYQIPIRLDGEIARREAEECRIVGLVVGSYRPE